MKIFIFGAPGSGKSTLAFKIAGVTGLPVFHIDRFFFKAPNIHVSTKDAMVELAATLPPGGWIVEGNHGDAVPYLASRADLAIILDVPPLTCVARIIKRHLQNDPALKRAVSDGWEDTLSAQFLWFAYRQFPKNFERYAAEIETLCPGRVERDARRYDCAF